MPRTWIHILLGLELWAHICSTSFCFTKGRCVFLVISGTWCISLRLFLPDVFAFCLINRYSSFLWRCSHWVLARPWVLVLLWLEFGTHICCSFHGLSKHIGVFNVETRSWLVLLWLVFPNVRASWATDTDWGALGEQLLVSIVVVAGTWIQVLLRLILRAHIRSTFCVFKRRGNFRIVAWTGLVLLCIISPEVGTLS